MTKVTLAEEVSIWDGGEVIQQLRSQASFCIDTENIYKANMSKRKGKIVKQVPKALINKWLLSNLDRWFMRTGRNWYNLVTCNDYTYSIDFFPEIFFMRTEMINSVNSQFLYCSNMYFSLCYSSRFCFMIISGTFIVG